MKLIEISVKNFRSINGENIKLSLENSNIIFILGQNNAGKSSLLSAYEYLVTPNQKALISDFYSFNTQNRIEIIAIFEREDEDKDLFQKKGFDKWVDEETNRLTFRKTWGNTDQSGTKETWDPVTQEFVPNGFGGLESHFNHHAPTPIRIPAFPSPDDLSKWVKETLKKNALKQIKEEETEACQRILEEIEKLQQRIASKDAITNIALQANKHFTQVFPGLSLSISQIEGTEFDISKSLESEFSVIINDQKTPDVNQGFNHHGHGVIRQAMFNLLGIVKNNLISEDTESKKFIILFEEPEAYLHPKAIKLLRTVLYELCEHSPFQILCASHSPSLIDISKPHTSLARLVRSTEGITSLYQVGDNLFANSDEQKDRVQMINRFDPNVCESFFCDEVVLVEGDTEAIVCREIMAQLFPTKDLYILNTGSKNNIPFFQKIFTHFNIKHYVIHDSDTRFNYKISINNEGNLNYQPILNKNGDQQKNSAWTLNETIWDNITDANASGVKIAQRFVSIFNFEVANNYKQDKKKGKPLSAYEFVKHHPDIKSTNICKFLFNINGEQTDLTNYSQENLENIIVEPYIPTIVSKNSNELAISAIIAPALSADD